MEFTYSGYANLIKTILSHQYSTCFYHEHEEHDKCVVLRHDVDNDLGKAYDMASLEANELGVRSTFFVLLSSDFYNIFSSENHRLINRILECGHRVGLHFDETRYPETTDNPKLICDRILYEKSIMEQMLDQEVDVVSMHRPGRSTLESDLSIPGMINSYSKLFFEEFKYLSDSRRNWKEPVEQIISSEKYSKIQLLTHPIWYDMKERSLYDTLYEFIMSANKERYYQEKNNFTNLDDVITEKDINRVYNGTDE